LPAAVQNKDAIRADLRVADGVWQALQLVRLSATPLLWDCWPDTYRAAAAAHTELLREQERLRRQQEQQQRELLRQQQQELLRQQQQQQQRKRQRVGPGGSG
jgi:hypothetical protein